MAYERVIAGLAAITYGVVQFGIYARTGCILLFRSGTKSCSDEVIWGNLTFAGFILIAGVTAIGVELYSFYRIVIDTMNDESATHETPRTPGQAGKRVGTIRIWIALVGLLLVVIVLIFLKESFRAGLEEPLKSKQNLLHHWSDYNY
jgi:hypothetical protein